MKNKIQIEELVPYLSIAIALSYIIFDLIKS